MLGGLYAAESLLYRVAGLIDGGIAVLDRGADDYYEQYQKAIEEYAGECAMAKVFCSNTLAQVADEALQIHGGYGYIKDYPVERYYRDERINRIFEGTNEINRLLVPTLLLRRADSGVLNLWDQVAVAREGSNHHTTPGAGGGLFGTEFDLLANQKQLCLLLLGAVVERRNDQEILLALGDMAIAAFALESSVLRAAKIMAGATERKRMLLQAVVRVAAFNNAAAFSLAANRCAAYGVQEETLKAMQQTIARLGSYPVQGLMAAKQQLASAAAESGAYLF